MIKQLYPHNVTVLTLFEQYPECHPRKREFFVKAGYVNDILTKKREFDSI